MLNHLVRWGIVLGFAAFAFADGPKDNLPDQVRRIPRLGIKVPDDKRQELEGGLGRLQELLDQLREHESELVAELLPDVAVFHRAVRVALEHDEFFKPKEIDDALANLRLGETRARNILVAPDLMPAWTERPRDGRVVRGYRSRIDHTVQPYGLIVPNSYSHTSGRGYRLDVWFHGRGETLSENNFITQRRTSSGVFQPRDTIVLHPYGRYSNAFKFAGEVDVLEAIEDVRRRYNIDEDRISVRGFSMGGAACWQFAVHYADRWFAANPGAGFSETPEFLKYFQKEKLHPTWFEEKLWGMYDCNKWATNLLHCPTVAYSGEKDIQKQAADIMEAALDKLGVKLVHLIGPDTGHRYHPDAAREVERRLQQLALKGRDRMPLRVDFSTHTLKYNRMHWVTVDRLEEHWKEATIRVLVAEPTRINVVAKNIKQFSFRVPAGFWPFPITPPIRLFVNGKGVDILHPRSDRSLEATVHLAGDEWSSGPLPQASLAKVHGLQGPIDDALMDSFIFVRPTGTARHPLVGEWASQELERAIEHWRRHFRGEARVKDDVSITDEDIAQSHLILWGDPQSNRWLNQIVDRLPITWGENSIVAGNQTANSSEHALIAVYPNPKNPQRYVVLNSSFTFREFAYLNNARQVPKLPDWAIVDLTTPPDSLWPGRIVAADFFDEHWQLKDALATGTE